MMYQIRVAAYLMAGALAMTVCCGVGQAQAADDKGTDKAAVAPDPLFGVSGGVTFLTDYRLRGASLSDNRPVVQGNIEGAERIGSGLNLFGGIWASSLATGGGAGALETDFYAGVSGKVGSAVWRVRYLRLVFFDAKGIDFNQFEGGVTVPVGPIGAGAGIVRDEHSGGAHSTYVYTSASYALPVPGLSVKGLVGYEDGTSWHNKVNWSAGAFYTIRRITFGANYTDTDRFSANSRGGNRAGSTVVFSIGTGF